MNNRIIVARRFSLLWNDSTFELDCRTDNRNFALSAGYVFVRMVKLLVIAGINIGRIDRPFLAPGVGRLGGKIELDNYPMVHTKDLLSHEAHRHPYIELLGVIYLMKLRYTDKFGNTAGSCWRLLFVYALFPWLHRYRVSVRPELALMSKRSSLLQTNRSLARLSFVSLRHVVFESGELDHGKFDEDDDDDVAIPSSSRLQSKFSSMDRSSEQQDARPEDEEERPLPQDIPSGAFSQALGNPVGDESCEGVQQLEQENARLRSERLFEM